MAYGTPVSLGTAVTGNIGVGDNVPLATTDDIDVGDLVVVFVEYPGDASAVLASVSDDAGNAYVVLPGAEHRYASDGTRYIAAAACLGVTNAMSSGGEISAVGSIAVASFKRISAVKVSGATFSTFDKTNNNEGGAGSTWTAGSTGTLSDPDEVVFGFAIGRGAFFSGSPDHAPNAGYTNIVNSYNANIESAVEYKIKSGSTAAENPGGTWPDNYTWLSLAVTFMASSMLDASASLTATGTLTATGVYVDGVASLTAVGTLTATAEPVGTFGPGGAGGAMGQNKTVVIRMQTLDGVWETVGSDRLRGVWPENDTYKANDWGPSTCSFDLKRDPGRIFPDLSAWTPCEVEIGGVQVWDGRVRETPIREADRVVNVQGFGWQFHLDDDSYQRVYIHRKLADWRDARSFVGEKLAGSAGFTTAGVVTADRGVITLGWPNGAIIPANACVGVKLDLGEGQAATSVAVEIHGITGAANGTANFFAVGSQSQEAFAAGAGYVPSTPVLLSVIGTNPNLYEGDLATPARYITIGLNEPGVTLTGDVMLRIVDIVVATDSDYITPASVNTTLKATDIIPDALDRATVLLSADRSGIDPDATVTFDFPEFAVTEPRTPREVINAANAVHGYVTQVAVGRRMIFKPKPSVPLIEIGAWPGSEFDDASANSAEDIYNRALVRGTQADGTSITVERLAVQSGAAEFVLSDPSPDNPSFDVNATGWTAGGGGSIARTTVGGEFDTAPGAGKWDVGATSPMHTLTASFTGTFRAGATYALYVASSATDAYGLFHDFGVQGVDEVTGVLALPGPTPFFNATTIYWAPTENRTGVTLRLRWPHNEFGDLPTSILYIDSLQLRGNHATLADRRGFRRTHTLPIENSLNAVLGAKVGDVFLAAHKTTPLRGTVKIEGNQGCRSIQTGHGIPPEQLLLMTEELLRLSHRVDPDNGGQGRHGRMAEVEYVRATDTAIVALDSQRTSHEALLQRLSIVVGS